MSFQWANATRFNWEISVWRRRCGQNSLRSSGVEAVGGLRLQAGHRAAVVCRTQDLVEVHQAGRLLDSRRNHPLQNVGRLFQLQRTLNRFLSAARNCLLLLLVIDIFLQIGGVENRSVVVIYFKWNVNERFVKGKQTKYHFQRWFQRWLRRRRTKPRFSPIRNPRSAQRDGRRF